MKLMELLSNVDVVKYACDQQVDVEGLCYDSRKSAPGVAFVAIRGFQTDGHKYIAQAAEKGAALVICETPPERSVPYVLVKDSRLALAQMSDNFFGHPAQGMKVIGVTGNPDSWLARESDLVLLAGVKEEGGPLNRAPRNSILAEILTLQALSVALQSECGQDPTAYVRCHPGGKLGQLREGEK